MDYSQMPLQILQLPNTTLVGKSLSATLMESRIKELWQSFMPKRLQIQQTVGTTLYAVEEYPNLDFFEKVDPQQSFTRWAAVEVSAITTLPEGIHALYLPAGSYAVFTYKGKESLAQGAFQYIYGTWLPQSSYQLADRPHFAKMGALYKGEDPNSEEEFWIPIQ